MRKEIASHLDILEKLGCRDKGIILHQCLRFCLQKGYIPHHCIHQMVPEWVWLLQISTKSTQQLLMAKISAQRENGYGTAASLSSSLKWGWESTPMGWAGMSYGREVSSVRSCGSSCYSKRWVWRLTSNIGNSLLCLRKAVGSRHVTAAPWGFSSPDRQGGWLSPVFKGCLTVHFTLHSCVCFQVNLVSSRQNKQVTFLHSYFSW